MILVFELKGALDVAALRPAGLSFLGGTQGSVAVAFANDPQLHAFLERVRLYVIAGNDASYAPHEGFMDVVETVRLYGPQDRVTARLEAAVAAATNGALLDLQLDLWHPGDEALAAEWADQIAHATKQAGGEVIDRYLNHGAGLVLVRVRVPAAAVEDLSKVDAVAVIDGMPRLAPSRAQARQAAIDDLPEFPPPADDAPLIGLIDSGVRSAHPLLAGAVYDAATLSADFGDGEDQHGHGTRIAALLLHGQLEDVLERPFLPRPFCRLMSVRVLGADNRFPATAVWEAEIERAIRHCYDAGARVISLSIADADTPYGGARSTPLAALLDQLIRELGITMVVPTGNVGPAEYLDLATTDISGYVNALVDSDDTALLDPAPACSALTVGGLVPEPLAGSSRRTYSATQRAVGEGGWPAPYSRCGPGIDTAVKPELSAVGGSVSFDAEFERLVDDSALGVLSASASGPPERLLDADYGTSYAVPLVARVAAAVAARYPEFSANLVRALTLLGSAEPRFCDALTRQGLTPGDAQKIQLRTVGFGEPRLTEAIESTPHRAILVGEDEAQVDQTIVYEVPIPSSFRASGGRRGIDIALAFDPPTRARRLDYAGTKMEFWLVRGMDPDAITEVFMNATEEELEDLGNSDSGSDAGDDESEDGTGDGGQVDRAPTPSALGRNAIKLVPGNQARSRGANQLARVALSQRLREEDGATYHLVVQCRRVWGPTTASQRFGVAVALWRDEDREPIYDELRARVELAVEVPVELELRR